MKDLISWREDDFREYFQGWRRVTYFDLDDGFYERVIKMRKQMLPDVILNSIDNLSYKKVLLNGLKRNYNISPEFSDEELIENRTKNNEKITKVLKKEIDKNKDRHRFYGDEKVLDFFHKPKYPDNIYFMTASPVEITYAYKEIETCVSPDGSNSAQIYHMLASPYLYIVSDLHTSARMFVLLDKERKVAFFSSVYGSYDSMMPIVTIQYLAAQGYSYVSEFHKFFDSDSVFYMETSFFSNIYMYEYFNMKEAKPIESNPDKPGWRTYEVVDYFNIPKDMVVEYDIIDNSPITGLYKLTTTFGVRSSDGSPITDEHTCYCGSCGSLVSSDDYDYDAEACWDCSSYTYCNNCGDDTHNDYYDFDYDMCCRCRDEEYPEEDVDAQVDEMILERKEAELNDQS